MNAPSDRTVSARTRAMQRPSTVFDLARLRSDMTGTWNSLDLAIVNTNMVRLRVMNNAVAKWHVHDKSDELFYVLSGSVLMDTERGTYSIHAGQLFIVPAGLRHRARVDKHAAMMVIDKIE